MPCRLPCWLRLPSAPRCLQVKALLAGNRPLLGKYEQTLLGEAGRFLGVPKGALRGGACQLAGPALLPFCAQPRCGDPPPPIHPPTPPTPRVVRGRQQARQVVPLGAALRPRRALQGAALRGEGSPTAGLPARAGRDRAAASPLSPRTCGAPRHANPCSCPLLSSIVSPRPRSPCRWSARAGTPFALPAATCRTRPAPATCCATGCRCGVCAQQRLCLCLSLAAPCSAPAARLCRQLEHAPRPLQPCAPHFPPPFPPPLGRYRSA